MHPCDTCGSGFSCGQLATAMKIVGSMPDLERKPALKRSYERIRGYLRSVGWDYPDGERPCGLVARDREIVRLTEELIEAMRRERPAGKSASRAASLSSILAEELSND